MPGPKALRDCADIVFEQLSGHLKLAINGASDRPGAVVVRSIAFACAACGPCRKDSLISEIQEMPDGVAAYFLIFLN